MRRKVRVMNGGFARRWPSATAAADSHGAVRVRGPVPQAPAALRRRSSWSRRWSAAPCSRPSIRAGSSPGPQLVFYALAAAGGLGPTRAGAGQAALDPVLLLPGERGRGAGRALAAGRRSLRALGAGRRARRGGEGLMPVALPTSYPPPPNARGRVRGPARAAGARPRRAPRGALLPLGRPAADLPRAHPRACSTRTSPGSASTARWCRSRSSSPHRGAAAGRTWRSPSTTGTPTTTPTRSRSCARRGMAASFFVAVGFLERDDDVMAHLADVWGEPRALPAHLEPGGRAARRGHVDRLAHMEPPQPRPAFARRGRDGSAPLAGGARAAPARARARDRLSLGKARPPRDRRDVHGRPAGRLRAGPDLTTARAALSTTIRCGSRGWASATTRSSASPPRSPARSTGTRTCTSASRAGSHA